MKRLVVTVMATVLLEMSAASAASSGGVSGKPLEITYAAPFTGGDSTYFDAMVLEFNASQRDIVMKTDKVKSASYYPRLNDALAARAAPDVVLLHQNRLSAYVESGAFLPLDGHLGKAGMDPGFFKPGPLNDCRFGGRIYAVPLDVDPLIMYYNKDLFAKAGITGVPESWAELVNAAKRIQEKTGAIGIAMDNTTAAYKAYTLARVFMSFLMEQGTTTLDATNTRANFNNPAGITAYQAISDMMNRYLVTPRGLDYDFSVAYFREGKAGIHFNGVWELGTFLSQPGLDFGAVPFPAAFGRRAAWSGAVVIAVPVQTRPDEERIRAVMRFIDWMTDHGELWARAGHIPARSSVFAKKAFRDLPHREEFAAAVDSSFATPSTPKWPACYMAIADSLEESIAANRDARTALADMERKVNGILAR